MADSSDVANVFISHSSEDNVIAHAIRDHLAQKGYSSFLDFESIAGGTAWEQKIRAALSKSIALVLCTTPKSIESKWVWAEVMIARYLQIPVIPLVTQGTVVPDLLRQTTQAIDFTKDPGRGYEKLLEALKEHRGEVSSARRSTLSPSETEERLAIRVVAGIGIARNEAALAARLRYPYGLALGGDGSLYFGDLQGVTIHRVNKDGVLEILTEAVKRPGQLTIDESEDVLYAASVNGHVIQKVLLSTGRVETVAGNGKEGFAGDGSHPSEASFSRPQGLAVALSGDEIYIADTGNHRIRRVDLFSGTVETIAGNGTQGYSGDRGPGTSAQLSEPSFLELDPDVTGGSLFFSDGGNHCIRRLRLRDGEITTVVGTGKGGFSKDGTLASECMIDSPAGLAITSSGLCFADARNHRIRVMRPDGTISTLAGTGDRGFSGDIRDARQAELWLPSGLCWNPHSNCLYAADFGHQQIKVIGDRVWLGRLSQ